MGEKIKKLLKTIFSNKKVLFLTLGLILFLSLAPLHLVQAGNPFWDGLVSVAEKLGEKLIEVFFGIATNVLRAIFEIIAGLLNWAVKNLVSIPVSPSHTGVVSIVRDGWTLSKDIVNIFFILILAFIGLATILRLQTYQAQKTLPTLIIVAILVNFSGVFVGFIVDMGNIVANFFLSDVVKSNTNWFRDWPGAESGSGLTALLAYYIGKSFYYVIASLIYFIIFLLFFVRVFMLWTLAILAPLAFGAYLLPATKKFWTQWLQQLIQWSIIGIPIGFFLYLSSKAINLSAGAFYPPGLDPNPLAALMAPFTALFLLFFGITLSMSMAPAGAQGVINWGKKTGMGAMTAGGLAAGTAAWRRVGSGMEKMGTHLREGAEKQPLVPQNAGFLRRAAARTGGFGTRTLAKWTGRSIEVGSRKLTSQLHTTDDAKIAVAEKGATNKDPNDNINNFITAVARKDWNAATGILAATMDKNGDTDVIREAADLGKIRWEDIDTAFKHAQKHGNPVYFRPILKGFLDKMQDGTLKVSDSNRASIWEKLKARDITDEVVDIKSLINKDPEAAQKLLDNIFLKADSTVTTAVMRHPKKFVREWAVQYAESKGEDWFINNRREDTLNTIISSGGRTMGVPVFGGLTRTDVNKKVTMRDAGNSAQGLRKKIADLQARIDDPDTSREAKKTLGRQVQGIKQALEHKEKSLVDLQQNQVKSRRNLDDAQKEITRLEKEEKSLQQKGGQLAAADKTTLLDKYKIKAQEEQLLQKIGQELVARGLPAAPRPRGIPAQQARLLSSSGPIGKTYQDWTRHQQAAQRVDNELRVIESGIQAIKDDRQRERALTQFTEIGTIARGEAGAAKTIKETIRKRLPILRNLPNDKRAESMKPFEVPSDQSTRLQQAQRDLENLKKTAEAARKERRLESEP